MPEPIQLPTPPSEAFAHAFGIARQHCQAAIYEFSELEQSVINPFFSNSGQRVFFVTGLPSNVIAAMTALYSRMKNSRGLRGVWCDAFLPAMLLPFIPAYKDSDVTPDKTFKELSVTSLETFLEKVPGGQQALADFLKAIAQDGEYFEQFASSGRVVKMLNMWLDKYGHNSIARVGHVLLCCERISVMAAKALEQSRLGAAYIELSTRYVDMHGADVYPIAEELACYGVDAGKVKAIIDQSFDAYRYWQGEDFNGPLPTFFREHYDTLVADEKDLKSGVIGETCDVLGNFLPGATLTSVGIGISGEGFGGLVQKLFLEQTPETWALAELILTEAPKVGANQFAKRYLPTEWDQTHWEYLDTNAFSGMPPAKALLSATSGRNGINSHLFSKAQLFPSFAECKTWEDCIEQLAKLDRGSHDKLMPLFESVSVSISGVMSFRSWRDIHRHVLCTHHRTLVTPYIGFYRYPKPAPEAFFKACDALHAANLALYEELMAHNVPPFLAQYVLALGNLVGFTLDANLRQFEFMDWQRTSFGVNDEVRAFCLSIEEAIGKLLPWWPQVSRASKEANVAHYCFARTNSGIPLPK